MKSRFFISKYYAKIFLKKLTFHWLSIILVIINTILVICIVISEFTSIVNIPFLDISLKFDNKYKIYGKVFADTNIVKQNDISVEVGGYKTFVVENGSFELIFKSNCNDSIPVLFKSKNRTKIIRINYGDKHEIHEEFYLDEFK